LGSVSHSNDAGFFEIPPPPVANIAGQVFNDFNENGLQDSTDPFIRNVTITLFQADGSIVATTTTDNTGNYIFENILAGDYYVAIDYEILVNGVVTNFNGSPLNAGDDALDSDFNPSTGQTNIISNRYG